MRRSLAVTTAAMCTALVTALLLLPAGPAGAAVSFSTVPYTVDSSNQAGWWKPMDELSGRIYFAFNAPGDSGGTHTVHIARRETNGTWTRGCVRATAGGACVQYNDDIGHNQPTIAVDGDGYIHAWVSMHNNAWRYYRSASPGDVSTMVNRSVDMPDQGGSFTYPVATRVDNGDVYLIIRDYPHGRLYRWNDATDTWSRAATFASQSGWVVYPDDVIGDAAGNVHIAWEWAYGGTNALRHYGSYMRYAPSTGQFTNAAGTAVAAPVTTAGPVVYQPIEAPEVPSGRDSAPGVQSAKLSLAPSTGRPVVAYRYRSTPGGPFRVRLAEWTGSAWQRSVVYAGSYDTYAGIDISTNTGGVRVYYAKNATASDNHLHYATRSGGTWTETLLQSNVPIERFSVSRRGGTDHIYSTAPTTGQLFYGTNTW